MSSNQRNGKSFSEAGKIGWEKTKEIHERKYWERLKTYNDNPSKCVECQNVLPYNKRTNKFCNHKCSGRYNNHYRVLVRDLRTKNIKCSKCGKDVVANIRASKVVCVGCRKRPNFKVLKKCECGREFEGFRLQEKCLVCVPKPLCLCCGGEVKTGKVYCGLMCQQNHQYKVFIDRWIKGEVDGGRGKYREQISAFVRRWVKEKNGGVCSICHEKEWMGKPIPLIVDHIDGNSLNTRPDNLRMVCGNCDMQLSTYKGRNVGKGRHYRRERYAEGKSY